MLVVGARRVLGVTIPPLKHFGPLLVVWGAAMLMLVVHPRPRQLADVLRRVPGAALRGDRSRCRSCSPGIGAVRRAAPGSSPARSSTCRSASTSGSTRGRTPSGSGFQIAQSLFAQADGGLFGQGFGQALLELPGGAQIPPAPDTDLIYAVITNELGLFGAAGVVLVYLLFAERGFRGRGAGRGRLLEAAGGRPDGRVRPAGVRDRGRRHAGDPADRRDAAVRQLRRQLDRRQLRAAGAAADGLPGGARAARQLPHEPGGRCRPCR